MLDKFGFVEGFFAAFYYGVCQFCSPFAEVSQTQLMG